MAPTSTPIRNKSTSANSCASEAHRGPRGVRVDRRYRRTPVENPVFSLDSIIRGMEEASINDRNNANPADDKKNENGKRNRRTDANIRLRVHVGDRTQQGVPAARRITLEMDTAAAPSTEDYQEAMKACKKTNEYLDEQEVIHQMIEREQAAAANFFSSNETSTTPSPAAATEEDDDDTEVEDVTPPPAGNTQYVPTASPMGTSQETPAEQPSMVDSILRRMNPFRSTGGMSTAASTLLNEAPTMTTRTSSFGSSATNNSSGNLSNATPTPASPPPADLFFDARSSANEPVAMNGDDNRRCLMCCDREINTVATPCGHMIACTKCAERCNGQCPMCMQTCSFVRVFKGY